MSQTKFTLGEWSVDNSGYFTRVFSDGILISEIKFGSNGDAHLISAAPDMYKLLNECYEVFGTDNDYMQEEIADLLKKARGEQ